MAILQVRDIPDDLYEKLALVAKAENRSITQETIVLIRTALQMHDARIKKRKALLAKISKISSSTDSFPDPVDLIREDRD